MKDTLRRARLDDKIKQQIQENVRTLLDKNNSDYSNEAPVNTGMDAEDDGTVYLFDSPDGKTASHLFVSLELTRTELEEYKKKHGINPKTKVKIIEDKKPSKKEEKTNDNVPSKKEETNNIPVRPEQKLEPKMEKKPEEDISHPSKQTEGVQRQIAIKDALYDEFGQDAKQWNVFSIHPTQLTPTLNIRFPDGTEKKYKDLSSDEKTRVKSAITNGLAASKGLGNYGSVSVSALKHNMSTNLSYYDHADVEESKVVDETPATPENISKLSNTLRENGRTILKKYSSSMTKLSRPMAEKFVDDFSDSIHEAVKDGSLSNVKQSDLDELLRESVKRLLHQEIETRRRSMGDHGIRHVSSNAHNSIKMLDELKNGGMPITGKQKLMAVTIMTDHDVGYTVGEAATDTMKGGQHKKNSKQIVDEEPERYNKIFGKEDGEKMRDIVLTHDDPELNWEKEPLTASIRLADNSSLFGKDKVQDLFLRSPKATELACKLYLAATASPDDVKMQEDIKEQLHEVVDDGDFEDSDRDLMHSQINEMSEGGFSTSKDILSRFSGRLEEFKYDTKKKTMNVNMKYSTEGQIVDELFGDSVACRQFDKFSKDLGGTPVHGKRGNTLFKNKDGSNAFQLNIDGFEDKPTAHVMAMRDFQNNTARTELQRASAMISPPPDATERDINKAKRMLETAQSKFSKKEWEELVKEMDENKDLGALSKKLGTWPLLNSEKKFLQNKTASARIARKVGLASIADIVALKFCASRGNQLQRKDKDLMSDTGGISKNRHRLPDVKPPRTEYNNRYRTKDKIKEDRDPDIDKVSMVLSTMIDGDFMLAKSVLARNPMTFREAVNRA